MQGATTSWIVAGLGVIVALIGWYVGGYWGAGILGFGLAHILLGILDMFRPALKTEQQQ
ncbi:hypothetical protein [Desulfoscipio geothermicus]|uniref:Uncharacterized protein n=1 Tax=Desulfoscipio geothermicus DSM 3669 TaxID=1121426 RepID=A0A1I6CRP7_9FIRM|nr:hypothetical protein [Desulfoscipio geothermicus]SFQ95904.1 hypothetical protein SAMN05660706_101275 [Desulfoscipio geothermicus DSM 3669]